MKTDLEYIFSLLQPHARTIRIGASDFCDIDSVALPNAAVSFSKSTLVCLQQGEPIPAAPNCVNLACIGFNPDKVPDGKNLLILDADTDLPIIEAVVSEVKAKRVRFSKLSQKLIDKLYLGQGFDAIVTIGSEMVDAPLTIVDTSFKIIAATTEALSVNAFVKESGTSGFMDSEHIRLARGMNRFSNIQRSISPVYTKNDYTLASEPKFGWLDISIRIRNNVVAYMAAQATKRPFCEFDFDCLSYLAKLASLEFQKNEFFLQHHGVIYESLLSDILDGRLHSHDIIALRLRSLNVSLKPALFIAIADRVPSNLNQSAIPSGTQSALRNFFPGSLSVHYHHHIVLLLNYDTPELLAPPIPDSLEEFLISNHLNLGISNLFYDLTEMSHHYQQAKKSLSLGNQMNPGNHLFHYPNYSIYHNLEAIQPQIPLRDLCHPLIRTLYAKGDHASNELLSTLECYLNFSKNITKVIEHLHIHRSTLFYRINKIKAMLGSDLDDNAVTAQLQFSFYVVRYLNSLENSAE